MGHMMRFPPMVLILLIWLAGLGAAAQFGKISVLYNDLRVIYVGKDEASLGLIVSIVGIVGLIFGTTAGIAASRVGAKRALVGAMMAGAIISALQAFGPSYAMMIALRILEGFSHLAIVVCGPILIAALATKENRAFAMTLWASFFGVAYAVLGLIAPSVLAATGPAGLFGGHAVWMGVLAALLAFTLPADQAAAVKPAGNILRQHIAIYRSPRISAPAMGFVFYTFLYVASLTLLPPAAPLAAQAVLATGMPLISILVSLTFGVWILKRISAVRLVQFGYLCAIPGYALLYLFWGDTSGVIFACLLLSAALGVAQGASFAAIPELNISNEDQAAAAGAVAQLGNVGTTLGTPILALALVQGGIAVLTLVAILCCLGGVFLHHYQAYRRQKM